METQRECLKEVRTLLSFSPLRSMWWISTLISSLYNVIEVPESYVLIQWRWIRMLVQPLSLLMSCSERSIWLLAQHNVAAQPSACHYPVSTTIHCISPSLTLPYAQTYTHTEHSSLRVQDESSIPQEPEAKVQLKPFVKCHTVLLKLGQLFGWECNFNRLYNLMH